MRGGLGCRPVSDRGGWSGWYTDERGGASGALAGGLGATLLRVAWLAILLGFGMEVLLLVISSGFGAPVDMGGVVVEVVGGVTWSLVVCTGLAIGTAASRIGLPAMGVAGLISAPLAFEVSRVIQKGTAQALAAASPADGDVSPVLLAFVKGVEYGFLGLAIAWIWRQPWGGALAHVGLGLLVGLVFGGLILTLTFGTAPQPLATAEFASRTVNEVLFPVGCSLVLFASRALAQGTQPDDQ